VAWKGVLVIIFLINVSSVALRLTRWLRASVSMIGKLVMSPLTRMKKIQRNGSFLCKLFGFNQTKPYSSEKLWRSNIVVVIPYICNASRLLSAFVGTLREDRGPMFSQYGPEQTWLIRDLLHDWRKQRLQRHKCGIIRDNVRSNTWRILDRQ